MLKKKKQQSIDAPIKNGIEEYLEDLNSPINPKPKKNEPQPVKEKEEYKSKYIIEMKQHS